MVLTKIIVWQTTFSSAALSDDYYRIPVSIPPGGDDGRLIVIVSHEYLTGTPARATHQFEIECGYSLGVGAPIDFLPLPGRACLDGAAGRVGIDSLRDATLNRPTNGAASFVFITFGSGPRVMARLIDQTCSRSWRSS